MATNATDNSRWAGREAEDELHALLRAVAAGQEGAVDQLLAHSALRSILHSVCHHVFRQFSGQAAYGGAYDVEDLKHEVLLHLIKRAGRLDEVSAYASPIGVFIRWTARRILLDRVRAVEGRGGFRKIESGPRQRKNKRSSSRSLSNVDSPLGPHELRDVAISELESLSSFLDSDPASIASMSVEEVAEELRELGLDADKPLLEEDTGVTKGGKGRNVFFFLVDGCDAAPVAAEGEPIETYAGSSGGWRTAGHNRRRGQIREDQECNTKMAIQEGSRESDYEAGAGGSSHFPPKPDIVESYIDTLEEELENELADPLFQVLVGDAEFQRALNAICKRLLPRDSPAYSWEDLKQDVLIKFGRWLWRYRYEVSFENVLARIARNQLVDTRRCLKEQAIPLEDLLPVEDCVRLGLPPPPYLRNAEAVLQVSEWLDALNKNERGLFVSHLLEGRRLADIARELGITRQAVSKRWLRILNKLRPLLTDGE